MEGHYCTLRRDALEEAAETLACVSTDHACPLQQCTHQAESASHLKVHLLADHFVLVVAYGQTLRRLAKVQQCPWGCDCSAPGEGLQKHMAALHLLDAWVIAQKLQRSYNYSIAPNSPGTRGPAYTARVGDACPATLPSYVHTQRPGAASNAAHQKLQGNGPDSTGCSSSRVTSRTCSVRRLLYPCPLGCTVRAMQPWEVPQHVLEDHLDVLVRLTVLEHKKLAAMGLRTTAQAQNTSSWSELARATQLQRATDKAPNPDGLQSTAQQVAGSIKSSDAGAHQISWTQVNATSASTSPFSSSHAQPTSSAGVLATAAHAESAACVLRTTRMQHHALVDGNAGCERPPCDLEAVSGAGHNEDAALKKARRRDVYVLAACSFDGLNYKGFTTLWLHQAAATMQQEGVQLCWLHKLPCQAAASSLQVLLQDSDPEGDWCCHYLEEHMLPSCATAASPPLEHALLWRRASAGCSADSLNMWHGQPKVAIHALKDTHGLFSCVPTFAMLSVHHHLLLIILVNLSCDPLQAEAEVQRLPLLVAAAQVANPSLLGSTANVTVLIMGELNLYEVPTNSMDSQQHAQAQSAWQQLELMGWERAVATPEATVTVGQSRVRNCNIVLQKGTLPPGCHARRVPIAAFNDVRVATDDMPDANSAAAGSAGTAHTSQHALVSLDWWAPERVNFVSPLIVSLPASHGHPLPDASLPFLPPDLQSACRVAMQQGCAEAGAAGHGKASALQHDEQVRRAAEACYPQVPAYAPALEASSPVHLQLQNRPMRQPCAGDGITDMPASPRIPTTAASGLGSNRTMSPDGLSLSWEDQVLRSIQHSPISNATRELTTPIMLSPTSPTFHPTAPVTSLDTRAQAATRPGPSASVTAALKLLWDTPVDPTATGSTAAAADGHTAEHMASHLKAGQSSSMDEKVLTQLEGQAAATPTTCSDRNVSSQDPVLHNIQLNASSELNVTQLLPHLGTQTSADQQQQHVQQPSAHGYAGRLDQDGTAVLRGNNGQERPLPCAIPQPGQRQQQVSAYKHDFLAQAEALLQNSTDEWMLTMQGHSTAAEQMVAAADAVTGACTAPLEGASAAAEAACQSHDTVMLSTAARSTSRPVAECQLLRSNSHLDANEALVPSGLPSVQHVNCTQTALAVQAAHSSAAPTNADLNAPSERVAGDLTATVSDSSSTGSSTGAEIDEEAWVPVKRRKEQAVEAATTEPAATAPLMLTDDSIGNRRAPSAPSVSKWQQEQPQQDSKLAGLAGAPAVRLWRPEQQVAVAGDVTACDESTTSQHRKLWRPKDNAADGSLISNEDNDVYDDERSGSRSSGEADASKLEQLRGQRCAVSAKDLVHTEGHGGVCGVNSMQIVTTQQQYEGSAGTTVAHDSECKATNSNHDAASSNDDVESDIVAEFMAAEGINHALDRQEPATAIPMDRVTGPAVIGQLHADNDSSSDMSDDMQLLHELLSEPLSLQDSNKNQQHRHASQRMSRNSSSKSDGSSFSKENKPPVQPASQQQQQKQQQPLPPPPQQRQQQPQEPDILQLVGGSSEDDATDDLSDLDDFEASMQPPRTYLQALTVRPSVVQASSKRNTQVSASSNSRNQHQAQPAIAAVIRSGQVQQQPSPPAAHGSPLHSLSDSSWADMLVDPDEFMKNLSGTARDKGHIAASTTSAAAANTLRAGASESISTHTVPSPSWQAVAVERNKHSRSIVPSAPLDDLQLFSNDDDGHSLLTTGKQPLSTPVQQPPHALATPPPPYKPPSQVKPGSVHGSSDAHANHRPPPSKPASTHDDDLHMVDALLEEMGL